jgi:hypothetical protein
MVGGLGSGGGCVGLHVPGGSIRVNDAVDPQRAAAQLQRHAERCTDHREVEVEAKELKTSDAEQVADALLVVAEVEVAAARDNGKGRCDERALAASRHGGLIAT